MIVVQKNALLQNIALVSLLVLVPLEIFLRYDTTVRQVALTITNLAAIAILLTVQKRLRRQGTTLPWLVSWLVSLGVWFDAAGNFAHLYARFGWWDKLAHVVGTAAVALATIVLIRSAQRIRKMFLSPSMQALFAITVATTLSALYEISEYFGDILYPTNRVTDLFDTADDLFWNFVAAVVVVTVALLLFQQKRGSSAAGNRVDASAKKL